MENDEKIVMNVSNPNRRAASNSFVEIHEY
jgi:hypothetical protein